MKKIITKLCALFVAVVMLAGNMSLQTYAQSKVTSVMNSKNVDLSGYKYYKNKKLTTFMDGSIHWIDGNTAKFSGKTGGVYGGTTIPDTIKHYDQATIIGIGSVAVSSGGPNVSISGSTVRFEYTTKKMAHIENNVSYLLEKELYTYSVSVTCSTEYQWGNINYRVVCGDN
ncbi:MAG: hypothetical protein ACI4EN_02970 [Butyrivibrio sp.]